MNNDKQGRLLLIYHILLLLWTLRLAKSFINFTLNGGLKPPVIQYRQYKVLLGPNIMNMYLPNISIKNKIKKVGWIPRLSI